MSERHGPTSTGDEADRYEIRLKGHLDSRWAAWFDGLRLSLESDGTTVMHGPIADQAALHGLLQRVRDTGLPLVSLMRIEPDRARGFQPRLVGDDESIEKEIDPMFMNRFQRTFRVLIPTIAVTALALVLTAGRPVEAAGIKNCVDVTGHAAARVACFEDVWVDDAQLKVTFFAGGTAFRGGTPSDQLTDFYVLAAQTDTPQAAFPLVHDHVLGNVPRQNDGDYSVHLHGFFVFCSPQGIASDLCEPGSTSTPFGGPFAKAVNGQPLTSAKAIEGAVDAGLITLLDSGGVLIGTIGPGQ